MTNAEFVTLCVAQSVISISSDERFVADRRRRLRHLFPGLTLRFGFHRRPQQLSSRSVVDQLFAAGSLDFHDDLLLRHSSPV